MTGSGVQIRQLTPPQRLPFVVLANAGISVPTGPVFAAWSKGQQIASRWMRRFGWPPCNRVTGRFYCSWAMIWPNPPASCIPLSLSFGASGEKRAASRG